MTDPKPPRREYDVQLHADFTILNIDPVPGVGKLAVRLDVHEVTELRNLFVEAVLNRLGYTEEVIHAKNVETGDQIENLGLITEAVPQTQRIYLLFSDGSEASFANDKHITVRRRIS